MPHAALCVSGRLTHSRMVSLTSCFNAARGIMCVGTSGQLTSVQSALVSMPHAALCVSGQPVLTDMLHEIQCFNAARSIVCVGTLISNTFNGDVLFQCRTRHYVCRDSVSRSPCPVRAEKAFWKDETAVCGFAPVPEHFPFPSPL